LRKPKAALAMAAGGFFQTSDKRDMIEVSHLLRPILFITVHPR
jgi:hypothetical protein